MIADRKWVRAALAELGIRDLVFGIHDASFPSLPGEDLGRGTPCSEGALGLLRFVRELGFDGVQLGPQGKRPPGHASPYDGALFARDDLALAPLALAGAEGGGLLAPEQVAAWVASRPEGPADRADLAYAERALRALLAEAFATFEAREARGDAAARALAGELRAFAARHGAWLERAALFEVLAARHGSADFARWPEPDAHLFAPPPGAQAACARRREELAAKERSALRLAHFGQLLAHAQHARLRREARALGLRLFADLQIGMGPQDRWAFGALFLPGYAMGAPPSRTNPEGQPWHYPVLDPGQIGAPAAPGPALGMLTARLDKVFEEFDAVRIDHPHGLVCPWVYRVDADPKRAVQRGARLTDSPDLPDHPELARFAIARPEQLRRSVPRYADDWVAALEPAQVDRYAVLFDAIVASAARHGRSAADLVCEVLSTQPYPLQRVMERHGLGRFRVTQKASLADPADVYRSENAAPEDWIMIGNHDTEPLLSRIRSWRERGELEARAAYLAGRLAPDAAARAALRAELAADPDRLAHAQLADLFVGPARHVMVFWTDLFGVAEPYNRPGTVSGENWSLRLPPDYAARYRARGLHLPTALALALRSRPTPTRLALSRRGEAPS